ncbi:hypothetical protein BGX34_009645 [Mortierella sp. NVP85]|nr:hypothetical protein BGX34_009645 [Mortierella sp. NVP85]
MSRERIAPEFRRSTSIRTLFRVQASSPLRRYMALLDSTDFQPTITCLKSSDPPEESTRNTPASRYSLRETQESEKSEESEESEESKESKESRDKEKVEDAPSVDMAIDLQSPEAPSPESRIIAAGNNTLSVHHLFETSKTAGNRVTHTPETGTFSTNDNRQGIITQSPRRQEAGVRSILAQISPMPTPDSAVICLTASSPLPAHCSEIHVDVIAIDDSDDEDITKVCKARDTQEVVKSSALGKRKAEQGSDHMDLADSRTVSAKIPRTLLSFHANSGSEQHPIELDSDSDSERIP